VAGQYLKNQLELVSQLAKHKREIYTSGVALVERIMLPLQWAVDNTSTHHNQVKQLQ
jgi:hypothetical protein